MATEHPRILRARASVYWQGVREECRKLRRIRRMAPDGPVGLLAMDYDMHQELARSFLATWKGCREQLRGME